jgi:hypothetical protein
MTEREWEPFNKEQSHGGPERVQQDHTEKAYSPQTETGIPSQPQKQGDQGGGQEQKK